jgi:release factor glutamine methyltransferase
MGNGSSVNADARSVTDALRQASQRLRAAGIEPRDAVLEARLLLAHALGVTMEALYLRPEHCFSSDKAVLFDALLARRARRAPLAYLTGTRGFYGLEYEVSPAVLIPRPETEFLVEAVLREFEALTPRPPLLSIADVGTGSGCVAVAVAVHAPDARVFASDISPDALAVARRNAERHGVGGRVTFAEGDLLAPLGAFAPFDVIASNPPYIAAADVETLMPEVRDWEPRSALGTHDDALHFYRRFAAEAPPLLAPGGLLAVEVGRGQAEAVAQLWRGAGLVDVAVTNDYAGIGRVACGRKPA